MTILGVFCAAALACVAPSPATTSVYGWDASGAYELVHAADGTVVGAYVDDTVPNQVQWVRSDPLPGWNLYGSPAGQPVDAGTGMALTEIYPTASAWSYAWPSEPGYILQAGTPWSSTSYCDSIRFEPRWLLWWSWVPGDPVSYACNRVITSRWGTWRRSRRSRRRRWLP